MAEVVTGVWGPAMDVILSLAPIGVLLLVTLIPHPLPTTTSLPLSAFICWLIRIAYFAAEPNAVTAQAFSGALAAVTPVTIVAGAIFLFESMDSSGCILWMRFQMQRLTAGHAVRARARDPMLSAASTPRSGRTARQSRRRVSREHASDAAPPCLPTISRSPRSC